MACRTRLLLARLALCRTQASSPGCTSEDAWPSCPGLRPAQLSQVDCFPERAVCRRLGREAGVRSDGWGRPQAGEPPVLSSRLLGPASSLHSLPSSTQAVLPSIVDSPEKGYVSPIRLLGQDYFLHHT